MTEVTCVRCGMVGPASESEFSIDGTVCRGCLAKANIDAESGVKDFERSMARRRVIVGLVMITIGIVILALGMSGGQVVLIPTGLLLGGLVELMRGLAG